MRFGKLKLWELKVIGYGDPPLLLRRIVIRCPWFGVFIHDLIKSDYDRALHDHPWGFISLVLRPYSEIAEINGIQVRLDHKRWDILIRPATWKHRVVIEGKPGKTLVLVGPRIRRWGFWPPTGWCWWRNYDTERGICDESLYLEGDGD